jgi:hypothetical protein
MLSVSPKRKQCIAEARKLFAAGDADGAWHRLVQDRYDHGIDKAVDAELRKLFPIPPDEAKRITDFQKELDNTDVRERQKAARRISGFVLGSVSNRILRFVQHGETMSFFIRNLDDPDPVIQEHMTICIARALDKYVHDDRAYEPLTRMTAAAKENTRGWAIEGLAALTDKFVPWAIRLLDDPSQRVRTAAADALSLSLALYGGGTIHRPPLGKAARRRMADGLVKYDLERDAAERDTLAWLLAQVAEPKHLPKLEEWHAKDKSKAVKKNLKEGIDRIKAAEWDGCVDRESLLLCEER